MLATTLQQTLVMVAVEPVDFLHFQQREDLPCREWFVTSLIVMS
jgi:hypothetical protein